MKNVLITGGAGFIGANFVKYFLEKHPDCLVYNYDKLTYAANLSYLKEVEDSPRYTFIEGDICDSILVEEVFAKHKIDTVVHFAAETHVDNSISGPAIFIETNVAGTNVLLEAARKFEIDLFFHVSTDEVYGSIEEGYVDESAPLLPSSPYSASKAGSDLLVLSYAKTFGLPVIVSRTCNNFGPFQHDEKFIPTVIRNVLAGTQIPVYGDGMNMRDWMYVEDNCVAIDTLLNKGQKGEVYNISCQEEFGNIQVVKSILRILGKSENLISFVEDRPGHDFRYAVKSEKIRGLGWQPKVDFQYGLEQYVTWYRMNHSMLTNA